MFAVLPGKAKLLKSVFRSSNFIIVAVTKNQNHATMRGFVRVIVVFVFVVVFPPLNYRLHFKEWFSFVVVVMLCFCFCFFVC